MVFIHGLMPSPSVLGMKTMTIITPPGVEGYKYSRSTSESGYSDTLASPSPQDQYQCRKDNIATMMLDNISVGEPKVPSCRWGKSNIWEYSVTDSFSRREVNKDS